METRFIDGGEFVDKATYIETRGGLRKALEHVAKLEADKGAWEACAQGHYEALSKANKRIAELEAEVKALWLEKIERTNVANREVVT